MSLGSAILLELVALKKFFSNGLSLSVPVDSSQITSWQPCICPLSLSDAEYRNIGEKFSPLMMKSSLGESVDRS